MEPQQLTFSALEKRIEEIPQHPSYRISPNHRVRWGNGIGMVAGLLGLVIGKMLPASPTTLVAVIMLLVIEIAAFVVAWTADLPTLNLSPPSERREYAEVLDYDMPHHLDLIEWLRTFPRERLEVMSAFASHRLDRFRSKLPLLTGGVEKLGFLPLAAALFLQFKDMHWPLHPNWLEIVLIGALMSIYWLSMLQLSLRFRLELYDALLKKTLSN
ncbi:MAG TPA: hypothetical protein VJR95_03050 [Rhodanobacter sp.]|nr:hypothetical protein [Rhodanobacter sp.]